MDASQAIQTKIEIERLKTRARASSRTRVIRIPAIKAPVIKNLAVNRPRTRIQGSPKQVIRIQAAKTQIRGIQIRRIQTRKTRATQSLALGPMDKLPSQGRTHHPAVLLNQAVTVPKVTTKPATNPIVLRKAAKA